MTNLMIAEKLKLNRVRSSTRFCKPAMFRQRLRYTAYKFDGCAIRPLLRSHARRVVKFAWIAWHRLWDVTCTSFDAHKDDSYTGRGRAERRRRDLRLRHRSRVAVEQKFNTGWTGENAGSTPLHEVLYTNRPNPKNNRGVRNVSRPTYSRVVPDGLYTARIPVLTRVSYWVVEYPKPTAIDSPRITTSLFHSRSN